MKRIATPSTKPPSNRRYRYNKVLDNRKHPIRGLWRRNSRFVARITVEEEDGRKAMRWVPLLANSPAEAQIEMRTILVERMENRLRQVGRSPLFSDYVDKTFLPLLAASGKKPDTIVTEKGHYNRWKKEIGHLRLDRIRASHVLLVLKDLRARRSPRTCNLALVCLRHVLKAAKRDGYLKTMPTDEVEWMPTQSKSRRLYTGADLEKIWDGAVKPLEKDVTLANKETLAKSSKLKNGSQLADYLRFLAYSGAREQEALKTKWDDVDFDRKLLTIGARGETKNWEARHIDFNSQLESHLKAMHARRAPDSEWLFPSPQRGERDEHAQTFRESMKLAREIAGFPGFGFHDCRHHFISYAVMSGIDFMTIARWVGHKDGGVLIGKVYGHLSNEHAQLQASRLKFEPVVVSIEMSG